MSGKLQRYSIIKLRFKEMMAADEGREQEESVTEQDTEREAVKQGTACVGAEHGYVLAVEVY